MRGTVRVVPSKKAHGKLAGAPRGRSAPPASVEIRDIAIKTPLSPEGLGQLRAEAAIHERLARGGGSRHIAAPLTIGVGRKSKRSRAPPVQSLVLPLLDSTLEHHLLTHRFTPREALQITVGLVNAATDLARHANACHCDLKPANVMFSGGDLSRPLVIDLGEARQLGTECRMTFGTPRYNAPELLVFPAAGLTVSSAPDVWAIAAILGDMTATDAAVRARLPGGFGDFETDDALHAAAAERRLFQKELRTLQAAAHAGVVPRAVVAVLERGLVMDPRGRANLQEMHEIVAKGLEEVLAQEAVVEAGPVVRGVGAGGAVGAEGGRGSVATGEAPAVAAGGDAAEEGTACEGRRGGVPWPDVACSGERTWEESSPAERLEMPGQEEEVLRSQMQHDEDSAGKEEHRRRHPVAREAGPVASAAGDAGTAARGAPARDGKVRLPHWLLNTPLHASVFIVQRSACLRCTRAASVAGGADSCSTRCVPRRCPTRSSMSCVLRALHMLFVPQSLYTRFRGAGDTSVATPCRMHCAHAWCSSPASRAGCTGAARCSSSRGQSPPQVPRQTGAWG